MGLITEGGAFLDRITKIQNKCGLIYGTNFLGVIEKFIIAITW